MNRFFYWFLLFAMIITCRAEGKNDSIKVYKITIMEEIGPVAWRHVQRGINDAIKSDADYIILHINTYGGTLNDADSIRTKILNCKIPVYAFIDNNAASAGALISIACDRIYMRTGASIGAATVVDQEGKVVPDKYQSFMRSMMRATAESHGKDTIISGKDTVVRWHRDPKIAEAMVDPRTYIPNLNDTGKVLSLTTEEAVKHGFCEGEANSINEVIKLAGIKDFKIVEYNVTSLESVIGFFMNPVLQSILIILIVAGIYYELQSPGIGFPLFLAITAAVFYFAPLYLEGLAKNWEIILFFIGIILILVEIFVIPGFGVTGISGITLVIVGLSLSLVGSFDFEPGTAAFSSFVKSILLVVFSVLFSLVASFYFGSKLLTAKKSPLAKVVLHDTQQKSEGFISVESSIAEMIGKTGIAYTILRPSGKIKIGEDVYDAIAEISYIQKGETIVVTRFETGQLYVAKSE